MKKLLCALALINSNCAFLEHRKTSPIFAEDKKLVVNIYPKKHYYVETSREEGIKQLRQLAATFPLEEAFFHVTDGKKSYWFECGEQETAGSVQSSSDCIQPFLEKLTAQHIEVAHYHIHPQKTIAAAIKQDQSDLKKDLLKYYSSALFSRSSAQDVVTHAIFRHFWQSHQNIQYMKSYAVAEEGIFAIYLDQKIEQDIVATSETLGRAAAVEKVYRSIESVHLEDIFALLDGALGQAFSQIEQDQKGTGQVLTPAQLLQRRLQESEKIGIHFEYHPF